MNTLKFTHLYSYRFNCKEIHFSTIYNFVRAGINIVQIKPLGNFCSGTRHGLGSDTVHGIGVESLSKCGKYALLDERCDGTGYFDAREQDGAYQCKCPENGVCLVDTGSSSSWSIYRASKAGTYQVDVCMYFTIFLLSLFIPPDT